MEGMLLGQELQLLGKELLNQLLNLLKLLDLLLSKLLNHLRLINRIYLMQRVSSYLHGEQVSINN